MSDVTMLHAVPKDSIILVGEPRRIDYVDSFRVNLHLSEPLSIDYLTVNLFSALPWWMDAMLKLRNAIVALFGLKGGEATRTGEVPRDIRLEPGSKAALFEVSHRNREEVVMADHDRHLDFRVSVHRSEISETSFTLEMTTVVWFNNVWGRLYFMVVKPFHKVILRNMLSRAATQLTERTPGVDPGMALARPVPLRQRFAALVALAGGLLVTWTGVEHFPMAYAVAQSGPFVTVSPGARDWIILLCLCVGLLLVFVGALSVFFAHRLGRGERGARLFFFSVGILMLGRTVVEWLHPVSVLEDGPNVLLYVFMMSLVFFTSVLLSTGKTAVRRIDNGREPLTS